MKICLRKIHMCVVVVVVVVVAFFPRLWSTLTQSVKWHIKGPRKAVFVCKGTLKIDSSMKVLCVTWPLNLIKCHCYESKYVYEEMYADQAEFRLLVLISKYARDPWRRSLTSQIDTEANEARFHHQPLHNKNATWMCGHGMRSAADQRVVIFLSHLPER